MNTTALYAICADAFGPAAWSALPADHRALVARDVETVTDDPTDAEERATAGDYRLAARLLAKRVGAGNLASYGKCLAAGEARRVAADPRA